MKNFGFFLFALILFAYAKPVQAQDEINPPVTSGTDDSPPAKKQYYFLSPRVSITVPHPMGNHAFRKSFVGIYEVSAGANIMLLKGFYIGASYKNGLLKITENKIADYNASMDINNFGLRLGADAFIGDRNRVIFSFSVLGGQNWTHYSGLKTKIPGRVIPDSYSCKYVEPEINLYALIEPNFGIGATISYSFFDKNFNPDELALTEWTQFVGSNNGITRYLSVGFGFYYSLFPKKGKA